MNSLHIKSKQDKFDSLYYNNYADIEEGARRKFMETIALGGVEEFGKLIPFDGAIDVHN
jgi:hypothetical protein